MLPLDKLEPLVAQLNNSPAWKDLLVLLNDWVATEAVNALAPSVDDFTRGRIAGIRQLVLTLDAARVQAQQRMRAAAEMREARRLDPLVVPGEYDTEIVRASASVTPIY